MTNTQPKQLVKKNNRKFDHLFEILKEFELAYKLSPKISSIEIKNLVKVFLDIFKNNQA